MPIPDFQSTMRPLLAVIEDGQTHSFPEVVEKVTQYFQLTEEEVKTKINSGKQTVVKNRISWARTFLKKAGLVSDPIKGQVRIEARGLQALKDCEQRVDVKYLKQYPEFIEFHAPKMKAQAASYQPELQDQSENTPEEQLFNAAEELNRTLASDLLDQIKEASPSFFEQLVVDLMLSMGYGGSRKEAGQATQYTADGGIDGIINEDPLGLDTIYLQAKRYSDKTVGRPEVQGFAGALDMQRAKKGVFITTSKFSADAVEFVSLIEKRIVLIDGEKLTNLMVEYGLGITTKRTVEIKTIDTDYFLED
jgi:restriction system protein